MFQARERNNGAEPCSNFQERTRPRLPPIDTAREGRGRSMACATAHLATCCADKKRLHLDSADAPAEGPKGEPFTFPVFDMEGAVDGGSEILEPPIFNTGKSQHHDQDYACTHVELAAARCTWATPDARLSRARLSEVHAWSLPECDYNQDSYHGSQEDDESCIMPFKVFGSRSAFARAPSMEENSHARIAFNKAIGALISEKGDDSILWHGSVWRLPLPSSPCWSPISS